MNSPLGNSEPATALSLIDPVKTRFKLKPRTAGGDKGYDQGPFLNELEGREITPDVAMKAGPIGGAAGTRYRAENAGAVAARRRMRRRERNVGYAISQRCRKKIEECFGWVKTIGGLARTRLIGHRQTCQQAHVAAAAFNLIRVQSLAVPS